MRHRFLAMVAGAVALLVLPSCGGGSGEPMTSPSPEPGSTCHAFALSLASDRGGQKTPVAAAEWFLGHGGLDAPLPDAGWHEDKHDSTGVLLRSGNSTCT